MIGDESSFDCGLCTPPEVLWASTGDLDSQGRVMVAFKQGLMPIPLVQFRRYEDLAPGVLVDGRPWCCNAGPMRFVLSENAKGGVPTRSNVDHLRVCSHTELTGFPMARTLHKKLLKHVLGLDCFDGTKKPAAAGKQAARQFEWHKKLFQSELTLPFELGTWEQWMETLSECDCPLHRAVLENKRTFDQAAAGPGRFHTAGQLAACHRALLPLSEAFNELLRGCVARSFGQIDKRSHLHLRYLPRIEDHAAPREELVVWSGQGLFSPMVRDHGRFLAKTAFLIATEDDIKKAIRSKLASAMNTRGLLAVEMHEPANGWLPESLRYGFPKNSPSKQGGKR
jgi:hypothetical protein